MSGHLTCCVGTQGEVLLLALLIVQSTKGKVVVCGPYVVTLLNWTPIVEW